MTADEAARHLGVCLRTVRYYISRGLLETVRAPGSSRKWLRAGDVEELRVDRAAADSATPASRRQELLELKSTVRRLVSEMEVVLRVLDMHDAPLTLSPERAETLYRAAVHELRQSRWTIEELSQWADVLVHLREEDLKVVHDRVGEKPWVPFLRLCIAQIVYAHEHPAYKTDTTLQGVHRRLTEARRRLRVSALCYSDMYETDQDRELRRAALVDSPASVREALLARARKAGMGQA